MQELLSRMRSSEQGNGMFGIIVGSILITVGMVGGLTLLMVQEGCRF